MTVDDVKGRLKYIWLLGQRDATRQIRDVHHTMLARDFVAAVALDKCDEPKRCAQLIVLPCSGAFFSDTQWR
jgi:hypothetical protein